ncbi:MAG: hypothetical protein LBU17_03465 [Treponema sp.]|nr:hypothetical protein [Treponema sp.]
MLDSAGVQPPLAAMTATGSDIQPQEVTIERTVEARTEGGTSRWVSLRVTENYTIYAVYDRVSKTDHYLVDNEIRIANGSSYTEANYGGTPGPLARWGYMTYTKSSHHLTGVQYKYLGSDDSDQAQSIHVTLERSKTSIDESIPDHNMDYVRSGIKESNIIIKESILDSTIVTIHNPAPVTSMGSTATSVSTGFSLSGSVDIKGVPTVKAGFEKNVSSTAYLPDLAIENRVGEGNVDNAIWEYKLQGRPQIVDTSTWFHVHDGYLADAPAISRTTVIFKQSWLWKVKNPKQYNALYMDTSFTGSWGYSEGHIDWWIGNRLIEKTGSTGELKCRIGLDRPTYGE